MRKSKIKTAIRCTLFIIIAAILFVFYFQIQNIQENLGKESNGLISITTNENKNCDNLSLQTAITNLINTQKNSTAAIMMKKKIKVVWEDWQDESEIETTKSQEWNAIVLTSDWYLLTNKHVIEDKQWIYSVIINKKEYWVDKIRNDDELDISIIKIKPEESLAIAKIPNMDYESNIWDIVIAIKNDIQTQETRTKIWIINSKNQKLKQKNGNTYIWLIKSSTAIEPWFSWWPLIDLNWNTIGINTAIDNIEYWASYSLPLTQEFITNTLYSIKENNKISRPYLGIEYDYHENWIKITNIIDWSSAQKVGLQKNDIIVWINNNPITYNNFLYELYNYRLWKDIILNIQQWNFKKDIQIKLVWK